jgi:hypothetical protein
MIVGFAGFIGSGKDTAADYLINNHQFRKDSFASALKDAVSQIFGWDRILLEGRTKESREWRDQVDAWWAARLKMPHLTPRWVLQYWGTEVCRTGFHDDIWIASLENRLRTSRDDIVISDVRFCNEIQAIHNAGGKVVRISRGPDPEWYEDAKLANSGDHVLGSALARARMRSMKIHPSEWAWIGQGIDFELDNNGTVDRLFDQIKNQVLGLPAAKAA